MGRFRGGFRYKGNSSERTSAVMPSDQDAVFEGDGAVHAPGEVRIGGGDQGGVGSGAVVTTHPGGVSWSP